MGKMIYVDESEPVGEIPSQFKHRKVIVKRQRDARQQFEMLNEIGRGKFGRVMKCRKNDTGDIFAAKFVSCTRREDRRNVEREVEIMNCLKSGYLLQLFDAFDNGHKEMCLITEYIGGGELFDRVIDDDFVLSERACCIFMRQILEGVNYIHRNNIIHLDLKPENILCLTKTGNRIKIIDFGLARRFEPMKKLQILFGTPEFVAPEVVNFEPIGYSTDMWALGVITYVLVSGLSPFMGDTDLETMANVTIAEYDFEDEAFEKVSDLAKDFIDKLLIKDKEKRATAEECLKHQWLTCLQSPKTPTDDQSSLNVAKDNLNQQKTAWHNRDSLYYLFDYKSKTASQLYEGNVCLSPQLLEQLRSYEDPVEDEFSFFTADGKVKSETLISSSEGAVPKATEASETEVNNDVLGVEAGLPNDVTSPQLTTEPDEAAKASAASEDGRKRTLEPSQNVKDDTIEYVGLVKRPKTPLITQSDIMSQAQQIYSRKHSTCSSLPDVVSSNKDKEDLNSSRHSLLECCDIAEDDAIEKPQMMPLEDTSSLSMPAENWDLTVGSDPTSVGASLTSTALASASLISGSNEIRTDAMRPFSGVLPDVIKTEEEEEIPAFCETDLNYISTGMQGQDHLPQHPPEVQISPPDGIDRPQVLEKNYTVESGFERPDNGWITNSDRSILPEADQYSYSASHPAKDTEAGMEVHVQEVDDHVAEHVAGVLQQVCHQTEAQVQPKQGYENDEEEDSDDDDESSSLPSESSGIFYRAEYSPPPPEKNREIYNSIKSNFLSVENRDSYWQNFFSRHASLLPLDQRHFVTAVTATRGPHGVSGAPAAPVTKSRSSCALINTRHSWHRSSHHHLPFSASPNTTSNRASRVSVNMPSLRPTTALRLAASKSDTSIAYLGCHQPGEECPTTTTATGRKSPPPVPVRQSIPVAAIKPEPPRVFEGAQSQADGEVSSLISSHVNGHKVSGCNVEESNPSSSLVSPRSLKSPFSQPERFDQPVTELTKGDTPQYNSSDQLSSTISQEMQNLLASIQALTKPEMESNDKIPVTYRNKTANNKKVDFGELLKEVEAQVRFSLTSELLERIEKCPSIEDSLGVVSGHLAASKLDSPTPPPLPPPPNWDATASGFEPPQGTPPPPPRPPPSAARPSTLPIKINGSRYQPPSRSSNRESPLLSPTPPSSKWRPQTQPPPGLSPWRGSNAKESPGSEATSWSDSPQPSFLNSYKVNKKSDISTNGKSVPGSPVIGPTSPSSQAESSCQRTPLSELAANPPAYGQLVRPSPACPVHGQNSAHRFSRTPDRIMCVFSMGYTGQDAVVEGATDSCCNCKENAGDATSPRGNRHGGPFAKDYHATSSAPMEVESTSSSEPETHQKPDLLQFHGSHNGHHHNPITNVNGDDTNESSSPYAFRRRFTSLPRPSDMPNAQQHVFKYTGKVPDMLSRINNQPRDNSPLGTFRMNGGLDLSLDNNKYKDQGSEDDKILLHNYVNGIHQVRHDISHLRSAIQSAKHEFSRTRDPLIHIFDQLKRDEDNEWRNKCDKTRGEADNSHNGYGNYHQSLKDADRALSDLENTVRNISCKSGQESDRVNGQMNNGCHSSSNSRRLFSGLNQGNVTKTKDRYEQKVIESTLSPILQGARTMNESPFSKARSPSLSPDRVDTRRKFSTSNTSPASENSLSFRGRTSTGTRPSLKKRSPSPVVTGKVSSFRNKFESIPGTPSQITTSSRNRVKLREPHEVLGRSPSVTRLPTHFVPLHTNEDQLHSLHNRRASVNRANSLRNPRVCEISQGIDCVEEAVEFLRCTLPRGAGQFRRRQSDSAKDSSILTSASRTRFPFGYNKV